MLNVHVVHAHGIDPGAFAVRHEDKEISVAGLSSEKEAQEWIDTQRSQLANGTSIWADKELDADKFSIVTIPANKSLIGR